MADDQPRPPSRYERVKAILDQAQGSGCAPDYGGKGRFWDLPLPDFLTVTVFGVRMISPPPPADPCETMQRDAAPRPNRLEAPVRTGPPRSGGATPAAASSSCCGGAQAGATASEALAGAPPSPAGRPRYPGRGAASGLIKALQGEFPFDGTHYPPFMWGGSRVAPSDILFIEQWIDDGCPASDAPPAADTEADAASAAATAADVAWGRTTVEPSGRPVNQDLHDNGAIKLRKNVQYLSDQELCTLRWAVNELMKLNAFPADKRSWNSWAQVHGDFCQHGWEQFLPWHRIYLYEFEQALQDLSPDITLPYWDWTMTMYDQGKTGVIPTPYQGFLTAQSLQNLQSEGMSAGDAAKLQPMVGPLYNSATTIYDQVAKLLGDAAVKTYWPLIVQQLTLANPLWYPFRYPNEFGGQSMAAAFHHHYPTAEDIENLLDVATWHDFGGGPIYDAAFGLLDMDPHNTIHIWVGGLNPHFDKNNPNDPTQPANGDMLANLTAAFDPIFWGHHSNVDRMWALWQEKHPGATQFANPDDALPPFSYKMADSMDTKKLGYEYAASAAHFPTDRGTGIARFRSSPTTVHPGVRARHRKAEVRLSGIEPPPVSLLVRVFLNQPDADHETPTEGNDRYVGHFSLFGHGDCVGGPGHCAVPSADRRRFDLRPRPHTAPTNLRLDATDAAQKLFAKGETDLSVQLVVLGPGGVEASDKLRTSGVTLVFKD